MPTATPGMLVVLVSIATAPCYSLGFHGDHPSLQHRLLRARPSIAGQHTMPSAAAIASASHPGLPRQETESPKIATARLAIVGSAALYSTYSVILRLTYSAPGPQLPPLFVAAMRFQFISLFACIFLAYRACERGWHGPGSERSSDHSVQGYHIQESASVHERGLLTAAAELAVIGLIGNFMTVWAVWRVQALTAEVLFGTIHIFVPLETLILGRLLGKSAHVGQRTWLGCAICMGAMMLLALSSAPVHVAAAAVVSASPSASRALGPIVIVCAMGLYGLGRVRAQHLVAEGGLDGETLNLWRMVLMGVASAVALLLSAVPPHSATRAILGALSSVRPAQYGFIALSCFLSAFAGSLLQFRGQRIIRAASAQPIYALSPLFAALWSCLLLDEPIAMHLLIAAAISVSGAILASTDPTAGVHSTPAPLDRRQCRRHSAHSE